MTWQSYMKILFCSITYGKNIFAGMENAAFNFVQGLRENGHKISVFTSDAYIKTGRFDGVKVHACSYLPNKFPITDNKIIDIYQKNKQSISKDILAVIEKENPDLIISWDPLWGMIQYLDKTLFGKTKTAVLFHVVSGDEVLKTANLFGYDFYFAVSNHLKSQINKTIKHDVCILPNSINFSLYDDFNAEKEKIIIINGRLSPEKGIEYGVKGCVKFLKNNPDYKLILFSGNFPFGDKSIVKGQIEGILKSKKLSNRIEFLDNIEWADMPYLLSRASVIILPSLFESFGIAALEAMASGTLLISTKVGNIPSLVKDSAILVKPESAKAIQDALDDLSTVKIYDKRRASRSRNIATKYDRKVVAGDFIKQVETAI